MITFSIIEEVLMRGRLIYNPMAGRFPSQPLVERAAKILEAQWLGC